MLNDTYYELLKDGQVVEGIPVLNAECLIPFKAKAWLDLSERKANGEQVDSKNIRKHKNDVFRLTQLLTADSKQKLSNEIADDMKIFLAAMEKENIDLKSLGIRGANQKARLEMLYKCYGIEK